MVNGFGCRRNTVGVDYRPLWHYDRGDPTRVFRPEAGLKFGHSTMEEILDRIKAQKRVDPVDNV